jgi:hypothetical protein
VRGGEALALGAVDGRDALAVEARRRWSWRDH